MPFLRSLNSIDPTSSGSDWVAVCLDPWFKQTKFLESHQRLDLQMAITNLAHREIRHRAAAAGANYRKGVRPKALDLLLGSDSPPSSSDSSDPVQDEVENYF